MSGEILSLQFGHHSNFVGTHWWNVQESSFQYDPTRPSEINHDVLFREGVNFKHETTFTPRLLLVDLKSSLGALPEFGELYALPNKHDTNQSYEIIKEDAVPKNDFLHDLDMPGSSQTKKIYDLEQQVRVWSDFLYARFHPRTVNIIREYLHNDEKTQFDIFPLGASLWQGDQFREDFADKIRNYVEECNSFRGFHMLVDANDGFSGLGAKCLVHISDEYDSKSVLAFPIDAYPESNNPLVSVNLGLCYEALSEHSSLFVPLSPTNNLDHVSVDSALPYHWGAVLAAALDTVTLGHRLKTSPHSLHDLCTNLGFHGRRAAACSLHLPLPVKPKQDLIDFLDAWDGPAFRSVTPHCDIATEYSLQLVTLRGIPQTRLKRSVPTEQCEMAAYKCQNVQEMLQYYMDCSCYGSRSAVVACEAPMEVKTPYPQFFDERVCKNGDVDLNAKRGSDGVERVSVLAGLHSGKFVGGVFERLATDLGKIRFKRLHQFTSEGVEEDQFGECVERILQQKDCYENDYLM